MQVAKLLSINWNWSDASLGGDNPKVVKHFMKEHWHKHKSNITTQ